MRATTESPYIVVDDGGGVYFVETRKGSSLARFTDVTLAELFRRALDLYEAGAPIGEGLEILFPESEAGS